jgi:DNA-binding GntR family transcriptional regulator
MNTLLRERVYEHVLDLILRGQIGPGEKMLEERLSSELSVSRTPIREALRLLESDGYVEVTARRGAVVASISRADVRNVYEIVSALEGYAVLISTPALTESQIDKLAQLNRRLSKIVARDDHIRFFDMNKMFHATIFSACRNLLFLDQIKKFRNRIARFRVLSLSVSGRMEQSVQEHEEILDAIRARKSGHARVLQERHVLRGGEVVLRMLESMYPPSRAKTRALPLESM